jgi:hypothetical protein
VYLAFLTSDIANSYFSTMGRLLKGVLKETFLKPKTKSDAKAESSGSKPNGDRG